MTAYRITATWGRMSLSETTHVETALSPEDEIQAVEDGMLDRWSNLFGSDFINGADEITTEAISHA